jgi:hypothetical protein
MGFSWEHVLGGLPKITEGATVLVALQNRVPETKAGRFAAITDDEGHTLPCSTAHRCPHPPFLLVLLHNTPDFIQCEHIVWCRRQKGFFDLWSCLDVRKLGVKRQVQVTAHVSVQVIRDPAGKLLKFSEQSAFAGQVLRVAGDHPSPQHVKR